MTVPLWARVRVPEPEKVSCGRCGVPYRKAGGGRDDGVEYILYEPRCPCWTAAPAEVVP